MQTVGPNHLLLKRSPLLNKLMLLRGLWQGPERAKLVHGALSLLNAAEMQYDKGSLCPFVKRESSWTTAI